MRTLLITARIPGRVPVLYDKEISDGKILVGVANPVDAPLVEETLRANARGKLKRIG